MIRTLTGLALSIGVLLAWPGQAQAAESYDSCTGFIDSLPATITTQGTWCLKDNLSTAITNGNAITIEANNVTVDCNGFKIGGLAAGTGTNARGVHALHRLNATVRNCTIRGFSEGIYIFGGGNHLIEDSTIDGSTATGIYAWDIPGSVIRNNIVANTGLSTNPNPDDTYIMRSGIAAYGNGGVSINNNTVNGVMAGGNGETILRVSGIVVDGDGGNISGNRVRGLATIGGRPSSSTVGIDASGSTAIFKNIVQDAAGTGHLGISCWDDLDSAHENVVVGFESGISGYCFSSANHTNPN